MVAFCDLLTVVTPTYNGAAQVEPTLRCLLAQSVLPVEIIVVDDASGDGTPELVESVLRGSPVRWRLLRRSRNSGGPARPVNQAFAAARTPWVAICEQDDRMLPRKIERVADCLRRHDVDVVLSDFCVQGSENVSNPDNLTAPCAAIERRPLGEDCHLLEPESAYRAALDRCFAVSLSNVTVRTSFWRSLGGLDETIQTVADHDFLVRASRAGRLAWIGEPLWEFQRHTESLLRRTSRPRFVEDYYRIWRRQLRAAGADHVDGLRARLRDNRHWQAHLQQQSGGYRAALRSYAQSWREAGPSLETLWRAMRLLPHYLLAGRFKSQEESSRG